MKRSDSAFSIALCASLLVHATLGLLVLREKLAELQVRQVGRARVDPGDIDKPDADNPEAPADETPAVVIRPAPVPLPEYRPVAPPPPPPSGAKAEGHQTRISNGARRTPRASRSRPHRARRRCQRGRGSRISRSPAAIPRGRIDSRMSHRCPPCAPGENGDGRKPLRDALAGKGTEGDPTELLNKPAAPATPPPPVPERIVVASAEQPFNSPQTSGRSSSQMPSVERRSPAEANSPPGQRNESRQRSGEQQRRRRSFRLSGWT